MVERSGNRVLKVNDSSRLLLFDLDGVLVTTLASDTSRGNTLLRLHPDTAQAFLSHDMPYGFITHRPRAQAKYILTVLGIAPPDPNLLICANDLAFEAIVGFRLLALLRNGLLKSLAFPLLRRRFGLPPHRIAVVDDITANIDDLSNAGCGLTMTSPASENVTERKTVAFDLADVFVQFNRWSETKQCRSVRLKEKYIELGSWAVIRYDPALDQTSLFSMVRRIGKRVRTLLKLKL